MIPPLPTLTPDSLLRAGEAAVYCRKSQKAFDAWVTRRGIQPDARTGRIRLYRKATLDRVMTQDAKPWLRQTGS